MSKISVYARYAMIGFLVGVMLASVGSIRINFTVSVYMIVTLLAICCYVSVKLRLILITIIFCILGIARLQFNMPTQQESAVLQSYYETYVEFHATVSAEPDKRVNQVKLTVTPFNSDIIGKVLVTTNRYTNYQYGDQLRISCTLRQPEAFNGFAYDKYLAKEGIYSICSYPKIKKLGEDASLQSISMRLLLQFKEKIHHSIIQNTPHQHASIISAMVLALRRDIPAEVTEDFQATGTSHVIAISGLHITILAGIIMVAAMHLGVPRPKTLPVVIVLLMIYLSLIGFPASASRASLMAVAALAAYALGKQYRPWYTLLLVATILVTLNPHIITADIGFQLSFSAVAGIMLLTKPLQQYLSWLPKSLQSVTAMTCAAQIATAPLTVYYFDFVSLIAPLANTIIVPLIPLVLISSILAISVELLSLPATALWYCCFAIIECMILINSFITNL